MLLERTCGSVQLVADSAKIGSRGSWAGRLNRDCGRDCGQSYAIGFAMDLLVVLRHHFISMETRKNAEQDTNMG